MIPARSSPAAEADLLQGANLCLAASRALIDAFSGKAPYDSGSVVFTLLGALKAVIDADPTIDRNDPATARIITMMSPSPASPRLPPAPRHWFERALKVIAREVNA